MENTEKPASENGTIDPIVPIDFTPNQETGRKFSYQFRWFHLIVLSFLLVSSVAAFFVLTARSVFVEVDPVTAEIEINGGLAIRLGPRYLMRTGTYEITLTNEGYHDSVTQLIIGTEQSQTHPLSMRRLPGIVSIATGNIAGARVQIDGVDIGETPLVDVPVEAGEHQMTISLDRYLDYDICTRR